MDELLTVLIVDDQVMARIGIREIINSEPGLNVVGEAADGMEAVADVARLQPDVVLMDIRMPKMNGIAATASIMADHSIEPKPRILMLTTFDLDDYIFDALQAGASGFLLKDAGPDEIIRAIRIVAHGDSLVCPAVTQRLVHAALAGRPTVTSPGAAAKQKLLSTLSEREHEALRLMASGLSNAELATSMWVSESTIKTHVSNVLLKLHLRSRVQAVIFAFESGLVGVGNHQTG